MVILKTPSYSYFEIHSKLLTTGNGLQVVSTVAVFFFHFSTDGVLQKKAQIDTYPCSPEALSGQRHLEFILAHPWMILPSTVKPCLLLPLHVFHLTLYCFFFHHNLATPTSFIRSW